MSAVLQPLEARLEPLDALWLEPVLRIEQRAYPYPWSRGNFLDTLRAGYAYKGRVLRAALVRIAQ